MFKIPKPESMSGQLTQNTDKVVVHVDPNANSNPEVLAIDEAVPPCESGSIPEDSYLMGNVYVVTTKSESAESTQRQKQHTIPPLQLSLSMR